MLSMSDTKKTKKQSLDNRTTKTKASATKPQVFGISLTRNKNNPNPVLFNSVRKKNSRIPQERPRNFQYQSETKQKNPLNHGPSLYEDLNTKVSIDYMNSLHSDLLVQFGYQLKSQLQNKENIISQRNVSITLPSKQQRECFEKIKELIELKEKVNKSYQCMKNTEDLFAYLVNRQKNGDLQIQVRNTQNISDVHKEIEKFLKDFKSKQLQLENLQRQYQEFMTNIEEEKNQEQETDQRQLDLIIESLQEQIAQQKKLCLRYEKQEKFLINKLYFTQKKNNDLKASSTNLRIKNTNLRDTIRLTNLNQTLKPKNSPKLHRSFSAKLQRIKKYNLEEEPIPMNQIKKTQHKLLRSSSHSSLHNLPKKSFLPNIKNETFLDRIL